MIHQRMASRIKSDWVQVLLDGKSYLVRMQDGFPIKAHERRPSKGFGRDYLHQPAYKPLARDQEDLEQRVFALAMTQVMLKAA